MAFRARHRYAGSGQVSESLVIHKSFDGVRSRGEVVRPSDQIRDVTPSALGCEECLKIGSVGASAAVPDLRPCRLLRRLPEPPRPRPFPRHRPPDHRRLRPAPGLGLVLCRRAFVNLEAAARRSADLSRSGCKSGCAYDARPRALVGALALVGAFEFAARRLRPFGAGAVVANAATSSRTAASQWRSIRRRGSHRQPTGDTHAHESCVRVLAA